MSNALDLTRIKANVYKMASQGAPETDIDAYLAEEGTTPEAVRAYAPNLSGTQLESIMRGRDNAAAGRKPEGHAEGKFGGVGMNAASGLNEGIYGTLGAPVDATRFLMNRGVDAAEYLTGRDIEHFPENSFGGSRWLAETLGAVAPQLDPQNTKATSTGDRVLRATGQGAAGALAPELAARTILQKGLVLASPQAMRTAEAVFGRSATAGQAAANTAIGAAGGAGGAAAAEAAPEPLKPVAGLLGGLAAGGVGAGLLSVPMVAKEGARQVGQYAEPLTEAGRQRMAAERLRTGASDAQAFRDSLEAGAEELVPGSQPTTFQATGDMGIGALERGAAARQPDRFMQRRAEQNAAQVGAIRGIQPDGAPESIVTAIRGRLNEIDQEAGDIVSRASDGARTSAARLGEGTTPEAAGASLRGSLEDRRTAAKESERALWNAVDPDGTLALGTGNVKGEVLQVLGRLPQAARQPEGEELAIYGALDRFAENVPLSEMTAVSSRLKTAMREERSTRGETPAYARMSRLRSAIERDLDEGVQAKLQEDASEVAAGRVDPSESLEARVGAVLAPKTARKVFTPGGRSFDVDYQLAEADDLIGSNLADGRPNPAYPASLQPRDRSRQASRTQVAGIARDLQPERLGASAEAGTGAPIVGPDGIVESGNGRLAAISRAYDENGASAKRYRDYLAAEGYDLGTMRKPVLIRRRGGELAEADRARFAQEANASQSMAMSASEMAATDASRLTPEMLRQYRGGDVGSAENRDFARAFLGGVADRGQEGAFATGSGALSMDGANRMRNALLSAAYGDQRLVAALADEGDENIRAFGRAMGDVAGELARLKAGIASGDISPAADLAPAVTQAAGIVQRARANGVRLPDALAQNDAFNQVAPETMSVLRIAYGDDLGGRLSRDRLSSILREATSEAEQQTANARLFGEPLDAATILEGVRLRRGNAAEAVGQAGFPGASPDLTGYGARGATGGGFEPLPDGPPGIGGRGSPLEGGRAGGTAAGGRGRGLDPRILEQPALTPNFDGAARDRLRAANSATAERVSTFDNTTLRPLRQRSGTNAPYAVPDSTVPSRIFFPQAKSFDAIQTYRRAVGDGPALEALTGYAVDRARKAALRDDGTFDPARLAAWRRSHADALRAFPELNAGLEDASAAAETLAHVVRQQNAARDAAGRGVLARLLNLDDPSDVTRTVGAIFQRQDAAAQMMRLRSAIRGSEEAQQGLRKAIADHIAGRFVGNTEAGTSGLGAMKSDGFQSFVRQNDPALRAAGFTPGDLKTMGRVAADLQRANRSVASVKLPGGSNTVQDALQVGRQAGPPTILSRILSNVPAAVGAGGGFVLGGGPLSAVAGAVGVKTMADIRRAGIEKVEDLVADALLDPRKALLLLSQPPAKTERATWELLGRYYRRAATMGTIQGATADEGGRRQAVDQ